jgi:trehalose 6-phosphate synthase
MSGDWPHAPASRVRTGSAELVVVADQVPAEPREAGPNGLVDDPVLTALVGLAERPDGAWVGRPTVSTERGEAAVASVVVGAVDATDYLRHTEQTIWPVYHDLCRPADYHPKWRSAFRRVSSAFAEAVADCAAAGASVWIHDYRLQLVPARLRALRPDLRIGFSLHTAFPPPDLFLHMPMRRELLDGLLGADTIGFQTVTSAENFLRLATAVRAAGPGPARQPTVGVFPTAVDSRMIIGLAALDDTQLRAARLRADLGSPKVMVLSIDNGDEASGVQSRLRVIGGLLGSGAIDADSVTFVQVVSPRTGRDGDWDLHSRISREVARLNGQFGRVGRPCVHYVEGSPDLAHRVALYRAADVMMATPLRDGVNLPALEFVAAARNHSALVLSEFSGTANALQSAYQVNPYDDEQLGFGLLAALTASDDERRERMATMRGYVTGYDTRAWTRSFLSALRPVPHVASRVVPPTARARPATPHSRRRPPRSH